VKLILLISLGVILALLITGGGVVFSLYDKATKIDRSDPDVTLEQYVTAVFDHRDQAEARLFTCSGRADFSDIDRFLAVVEGLEKKYSIRVSVSIIKTQPVTHGNSSKVDTTLVMDVPEENGSTSRALYKWLFDMRDQAGWRVCAAHNLS
jgi:hypothetical protein